MVWGFSFNNWSILILRTLFFFFFLNLYAYSVIILLIYYKSAVCKCVLVLQFIIPKTLLRPMAFSDFSIKVWALSCYGLSSSFDLIWGLFLYCLVLCSWWVGNLFCLFNIRVTLLILSLKIQTLCFFVLFSAIFVYCFCLVELVYEFFSINILHH